MSFNWTPGGEELDPCQFDTLESVDVLYEYDGPMIFTFKNKGNLHLAYMSGKTSDTSRFSVSPTSDKIIKSLNNGEISIREALLQPWLWCIDVASSGAVQKCWITSPEELPKNVLPAHGVMIDPSFEPIFSVRVDGKKLKHDNVPASAIKRAVDGAYNALKKLSEEVSAVANSGRPPKAWKQMFDLPAKQVRLGSFEISFQEPVVQPSLPLDDLNPVDAIIEKGELFSSALNWATTDSTDEPSLQLLEAMEKLIPPQHGLIERVYIGGRILKGGKREYILDRSVTTKVRTALTKARTEEETTLAVKGIPRELDKDRMSFRFRADNGSDYTCVFQDDIYDDVMEIFQEDEEIAVMLTVKKRSTAGKVVAIIRNPDADFSEVDDESEEATPST